MKNKWAIGCGCCEPTCCQCCTGSDQPKIYMYASLSFPTIAVPEECCAELESVTILMGCIVNSVAQSACADVPTPCVSLDWDWSNEKKCCWWGVFVPPISTWCYYGYYTFMVSLYWNGSTWELRILVKLLRPVISGQCLASYYTYTEDLGSDTPDCASVLFQTFLLPRHAAAAPPAAPAPCSSGCFEWECGTPAEKPSSVELTLSAHTTVIDCP